MSILNNPSKFVKETNENSGITIYLPINFPKVKDITFFPYICENNKKYMLRFCFGKEKVSAIKEIEFVIKNGIDSSGNRLLSESFSIPTPEGVYHQTYMLKSEMITTENVDIMAQDAALSFIERINNLKEGTIIVRFKGRKNNSTTNIFGDDKYSTDLGNNFLCFKEIYAVYSTLKQEEFNEITSKANEPNITFPPNRDFRSAKWNMPANTVEFLERAVILSIEDNKLIFDDSFCGFPVYISYFFSNDHKLSNANYSFQQTHSSQNDYITDYQKIKSLMTEKLGSPKTDSTNWINNLSKDKPEEWGKAISLGHLILSTTWENGQTQIILQLNGKNNYIHLDLSYTPLTNNQESDMDKL